MILLKETFDNTTDYDNAGWSVQGSVNPNYTTTVLNGTQSLFLDGNAAYSAINTTFTSQTAVFVYFQWRTGATLPSFSMIFKLANVSETECARIFVKNDPAFFVDSNGVFAGGIPFSINTTYHFWLSYVKGTGADAVVTLGVSTDGIRPTSGTNYLSITNGAGVVNAEWIRCVAESNAGWNCIFDRVLVSTTQIGDYPWPDVSVPLTGIGADPQIGTGTVTIGSAAVTPPVQDLVPSRWFGLPEDEKVYLTGVAANPQVGTGTVHTLSTAREIAARYPFPQVEVPGEPRRIPPLVVREPAKPPPPPFDMSVYLVGPRPMTAIGTGRVKIVAELSEYELMLLAAMDN